MNDDPLSAYDSVMRMRAEREAMARATLYAAVDPFYEGIALTDRERALMHMALRAYTHPTDTEVMTLKLSETS